LLLPPSLLPLRFCVIGSPVSAASPNFLPDVVFKGSSLTGWHRLGQADWRADNGEIIATPKEGGGWLMLDKGYQDIAFYASFHCAGACQTGVLLRAERTAGGTKGIYVSLAVGDIAGYDVLLGTQGKEASRTALGPGPGMARMGAARFSGAEDLVPGFAKPGAHTGRSVGGSSRGSGETAGSSRCRRRARSSPSTHRERVACRADHSRRRRSQCVGKRTRRIQREHK